MGREGNCTVMLCNMLCTDPQQVQKVVVTTGQFHGGGEPTEPLVSPSVRWSGGGDDLRRLMRGPGRMPPPPAATPTPHGCPVSLPTPPDTQTAYTTTHPSSAVHLGFPVHFALQEEIRE